MKTSDYQLPDEFDEFITCCQAQNHSVRTIECYREHLQTFLRWLAERNETPFSSVEAITHRVLNKYLADKRRWKPGKKQDDPVSDATIRSRYLTLSSFFSWSMTNLELQVNPMDKVAAPKVTKKKPRMTEYEEFKQLEASIKLKSWVDYRDRLAVRTFFLTGIRLSGLVNLRVNDYDVATRLLVVRNKGGDDLLVPMLQPVIDAYIDYRFVRPLHTTDYVFLASDGAQKTLDRRLSANGMYQRIKVLCRRARRPLNPHAFRHGLAMHLLNTKHADAAVIQRILGHSKIQTTLDSYARWSDAGISSVYRDLMDEE